MAFVPDSRTIQVCKLFPPNDNLAVSLARLCILREDLFLELRGYRFEEIHQLDENSVEWRKLYFFRNFFRTIFEMIDTVDRLKKEPKFKLLISKIPPSEKENFNDLIKSLGDANNLVIEIRHSLGGHVGHRQVKDALAKMDKDRTGPLEFHAESGKTHYKFASELIMSVIMAGLSENEQKNKIEFIIQKTEKLIKSVDLGIQILFVTNCNANGLWNR